MSTRTREHASSQRRLAEQTAAKRRTRRRQQVVTTVVVAALASVVAAMMWTARSTTSDQVRTAPSFSLTDTTGSQVTLSDYRGRPVLLYFSEGAGCGSCLTQMAAIERDTALTKTSVAVLPIVMNPRSQIVADMRRYGVTTPFLLDNGTVSRAYGMLGKGMHAGLPGHGFVLIDPEGKQRWKGEYPSMWLAPAELLKQLRAYLEV